MVFLSHLFDVLHISMSNVQHSWVNSSSCPRVRIEYVCVHMYICIFFAMFYLCFLFFSCFACPSLLIIWLLHYFEGHQLNLSFDTFYKNTFTYCAVVHPKVRAPKPCFLCPGFWIQMYRKNMSLLEKHFGRDSHFSPFYHLYVFIDTWRHGWNSWHILNSICLKSSSLLSPSTLSILFEPVYASWSQKSLMERFQFSSFIMCIDKTSLSLSQDSKGPCHYPGSICVSSPLHPHLVRVMRIMHNAKAELHLGRGFQGDVCGGISQVHVLAWREQPWESIRQLFGLSL